MTPEEDISAEEMAAYIDQRLSAGERASVEARLAGNAELRAEMVAATRLVTTPDSSTQGRSSFWKAPAGRSRVSRVIGALALAPVLVTCSGDSTPTVPGNETVTQAVGPAGGTVVTPSGAAGVQIPAGTFSQQVMVTITRLPTPGSPGAGPLSTSLKQYGPYYDFTTSPLVAQFGDSARVGVCQVTDPSSPFYPPEPHDRLRLAHTVGNNVEILERVGVLDFLRCTGVTASISRPARASGGWRELAASVVRGVLHRFAPAPLYAAHGGLGGKVKSFSPFGAVDPAVATVTVTLASPTVGVGNSIQASAVLKDADGNVLANRLVTWTSNNVAVATVSSSGLVTGVLAGGPVTITATSEGQSGTGAVTVTAIPVASVTVSPGSSTVNVGATAQLTATTKDANGNVLTGRVVTWTTSDAALATVNATGLVTGVATGGPVTITATSEGQSGTAAVTVVPPQSDFANISAGNSYTCSQTTAGATYCWGYNVSGALGDGTTTNRLTPTPVSGGLTLQNVVTGGYHTCALTGAGTAYCWGYNAFGEIGIGNTTDQLTPTNVSTALTFTTLGLGSWHSCGLSSNGAAYCWGDNADGEVGDGTTTNRPSVTAVIGGLSFKSVAVGGLHACGLTAAGSVYCWGRNLEGQLGDGTTTNRATPVAVLGGLTFVSLDAGSFHTCGLTASGVAYCWGDNQSGELGDGTTTNQSVPTRVSGGLAFTSIGAGDRETCGLTGGGSVYCWGDNRFGQLGDGSTLNHSTPILVVGGITFGALSVGYDHVCGVTSSRVAYCWGFNASGEIGDGTTTNRLTPTLVLHP